ncbi:Replication protein A 70 kDa DNA-binding subunit B [Abeliophyllum distichum]|uniref:Replication protein A 70 kDa DNA-binding subunit B n=1 Tax=Abeliophyllum distichum TaxID=126358 RepID=A0ABD1TYY9_9LAMI
MGEENGLRAEMNAGTDYSDFSWRPIPWFQSCAAGSTTCFGCHIKTHDDSIPKSQQFIVMTPSGVQKERVVDEDMYVLSTNGSVLFEPLAKSWPHKPPRCFVLEGMLYTKKMDTKYKLIPEISVTEKDKNWTAKVIVSEKTSARTSQNGSIRYQNLILMDPQKNKIQATLFDNHITAFEDLLLLSKTYLISNATIKLTKPEYVASVGPIHWVITGKTRVIEIQEDNNALLSSTYNFTPFDKLKEYMDVNADISIIGVAIDIKPKRLIKVRSGECVYISQHLSKKPIVIAKHLKVSSFHGLSLSTKGNSSFFIDAPFTQVTELKSWVDENIENLNQLIVEKSYFIASPAKVPIPNDKMITYIKNISGLHHMQTYFWVKAKANLQRQEQAYWYMSCSNCNKLSGADVNEVFECVFCKCKQAYGAPRARATIQLQDATSSLLATVIGPPAETFFKCSAYDLMKGTTKNENSDIVETMRTSIEEDVLFYVKAVPKDKQEGYKYDVIFIINPSEIPGKNSLY